MNQQQTAKAVRRAFLSWLGLDFKPTWKYKFRNGVFFYECTLMIHKHSVTLSVEKAKMEEVESFVEEMKQQLRDVGYPGLILPRHLVKQPAMVS